MSRWKLRLGNHGIDVGNGERLTNIRYADEIMLYPTSCSQLAEMLDILCAELGRVGLHLKSEKTKVFTRQGLDTPSFWDVAGGMVEILTGKHFH